MNSKLGFCLFLTIPAILLAACSTSLSPTTPTPRTQPEQTQTPWIITATPMPTKAPLSIEVIDQEIRAFMSEAPIRSGCEKETATTYYEKEYGLSITQEWRDAQGNACGRNITKVFWDDIRAVNYFRDITKIESLNSAAASGGRLNEHGWKIEENRSYFIGNCDTKDLCTFDYAFLVNKNFLGDGLNVLVLLSTIDQGRVEQDGWMVSLAELESNEYSNAYMWPLMESLRLLNGVE